MRRPGFEQAARARAACALALAALSLSLAAPAAAQYTLVFEDEFDGTQVDPARWQFQIGTGCPSLCGWGNNELQYYRAENASVAGGLLRITAKQESFGGRSYTSARLRTQGLADFAYGKIEMRAKLPIGRGLWPAFWMLPTASPYGGWPVSGEIDIMEYVGHQPSRVFGTLHYGNPGHLFASTATTLPAGTFHDDFHVFGIEWEPNRITWLLDGVPYGCTSHWVTSAAPYPAPFDTPFHLLLNLAVGGNLPGPPDGTTVFPQEFVVDWVRVWQRPAEPRLVFDGMDHANPLGNGWFVFNGAGGGGIGGNTADLPPQDGCTASLEAGWGGPAGYIGGFGRGFPLDLTGMTHFEFWIRPDPGQSYTLQINLQDDDDGNDSVPSAPNGRDDEFQYDLVVGPSGPGAIAGGGWQKISIPLSAFFDDNSYHWGGNGVFDPYPVAAGGNGRLVNVVIAIISPSGGDQTFRTDFWSFRNANVVSVPAVSSIARSALRGVHPNPASAGATIRFSLDREGSYELAVYDLRGRRVRRLESGRAPVGDRSVRWDGMTTTGGRAAPGVYLVRLTHGGATETLKLVLQQ